MRALFYTLMIGFSVASAKAAVLIQDCRLSNNPDSGVRIQILNLADQGADPLLIAAVLSAGNIKPYVISSYPVSVKPNGAGIISYVGKGFVFERSTQTGALRLYDANAGITMSGAASDALPHFFKCVQ